MKWVTDLVLFSTRNDKAVYRTDVERDAKLLPCSNFETCVINAMINVFAKCSIRTAVEMGYKIQYWLNDSSLCGYFDEQPEALCLKNETKSERAARRRISNNAKVNICRTKQFLGPILAHRMYWPSMDNFVLLRKYSRTYIFRDVIYVFQDWKKHLVGGIAQESRKLE